MKRVWCRRSTGKLLAHASAATMNVWFPAAFSGGLYLGQMSGIGTPWRSKSVLFLRLPDAQRACRL